MNVFRRKIYQKMLEWKSLDGRYALMVDGARRVGKTTVVKEFAEREYDSHIIIDFSVKDPEMESLFRNIGKGLDRFFLHLKTMTGVRLYERRSVIIFDEIQMFPLARQTIKHLVADGRYDYIETGSLISIKKNVKDILVPSEELTIRMHPMDFEEFLWAIGKCHVMDLVRECFERREPLGFETHRSIMELYSMYMIVGGMPQAVSAFVEDNDFSSAEIAKTSILELYLADAVKINARRILRGVPYMLAKHDKTFSPSQIRADSRTRDYLGAVDWLRESRMVNVCTRTTDPGPAPGLSLDELTFKLYLLDTGLLLTSALSANMADRRTLLLDMMKGDLNINEGMLFENMVAQELVMTGHELEFAKFRVDGSTNLQEVDFIIADGHGIVPIECKSGVSARHASLDRFIEKYGERISQAYVIHTKDLRVDGDIVYIPAYMTMLI